MTLPFSVDILVIEDNPGDELLIREAFKAGSTHPNLHFVTNGKTAMDFLRHNPPYSEVPKPDLILLDLSLPGRPGDDILAEIKSDATLKRIPVVVFTASASTEEILECYRLQANCYIDKPIDMESFLSMVHAIETYWLQLVRLPHE